MSRTPAIDDDQAVLYLPGYSGDSFQMRLPRLDPPALTAMTLWGTIEVKTTKPVGGAYGS
jgi:hypothetical protein